MPRETTILVLGGLFSGIVCVAGVCWTDVPVWFRLLAGVGTVFTLWCVRAGIRAEISIRRGFRQPR